MIPEFLDNHTVRTVALGSAVLGAVSGTLGAFAVLRRQSLLGDAISHAALPGIALAFLLTGTKSPLALAAGAAAAGLAGMLLVMTIVRATRVKDDSALGIVLSVFFGFGLVLLTWIQKLPDAAQAGLDRFLFGQAATLLSGDVLALAAIGSLALLLVLVFWKEFKLLSFDPDFAASLGFPVRLLDVGLTGLLVIAIVLGLQTVGVVLMSAMVVAPGAAARQWTDRLGIMVLLSALFGAASGVTGAVLSSTASRLPTGPTIVLCVSALVLVSLLFAPGRGMVAGWLRRRRNGRRLRLHAVLADLYELELQHGGAPHGHSLAAIEAMSFGLGGVERSLRELEARGLAHRTLDGRWVLTAQGTLEATRLARMHTASESGPPPSSDHREPPSDGGSPPGGLPA